MRMSREQVVHIDVANKTQYLQRSWTLPNDSKHTEASFSTILTDTLYLRVAEMPRSLDLAIFVLWQTNYDDRYTLPLAHARGVIMPHVCMQLQQASLHVLAGDFTICYHLQCHCFHHDMISFSIDEGKLQDLCHNYKHVSLFGCIDKTVVTTYPLISIGYIYHQPRTFLVNTSL